MMVNSLQTVDRYSWWASLKHGGLLVAPSKLAEFFPDEISPLPRHVEDRLRRDVNRVRSGDEGAIVSLLDTVLEDVLQLSKDWWIKGSGVDRSWTQQAITKESIKPRRVWLDPQGGILPVFVADAESRVVARLGIGKGRRAVSRAIEWLRKANQKIALLTNGRQWRLIHAGTDYDAWCEWDIDLWFEEGQPGLQVAALRLLLGQDSLHPEKVESPSRLIAAIVASRQGQAELSGVLGERVRLAVELLIRESGLGSRELGVGNRDIYIAATRIIMRCVVILFAEARDLLPRNNPIYHGSYGIQGLREQLDRLAGGRATERLRNGFSAWPRLLALFQLVDRGCSHEALPVPRYGGGLFTPGDSDAKDAILRSLSAFEHPENAPSDAVIYRILELLCRSKVKVRQRRSTTWVEAPVDFSDLSSEYIGILYEGLLDFELRRAGEDDPMIFLNLGDQPVLPLARLEGMDNAALSNLVEKLKKKSKLAAGEDSEAEEEETEEVEEEAEEEIEEDAALEADIEELEADLDKVQQLRERTHQWAMRAVEAGKLVAKPRGTKAEALTRYQQEVSKAGDRLIARIVLPGEWFLVRWGGTRKGSGTFYTRPQLAIPTTRRTLQPLAYQGELPKLPEEILALKVCDPAMGSGSFPVAALRFLTDALYESLHYHNRIEAHGDKTLCRLADGGGTNSLLEETLPVLPDADDFEERLKARLKRYIVERCIYGVDLDPLAVELARLSLWVETMDRTLPFSFLDHKLKCGNSLVGCWFDRFQDYPAMAWERKGGDENHTRFVHHFREVNLKGKLQQKGDKWNQAIKDAKNDLVKAELKRLVEALDPIRRQQLSLPLPEFELPQSPDTIHDEAKAVFEELHDLPVFETEERERRYQEGIEGSEAIRLLRLALDTWCAVWFWSGEDIEIAPTPGRFFNPPAETREMIEQLAEKYQFFHWELEFPDVFASANAGFDAIIGNPPWETLQPNSMEFFSNIDPLYRTYGKQEALNKQLEYFNKDATIERDWLAYCDWFKAITNWYKQVALPFGDEADGGEKFSLSKSKKESQDLHEVWRRQRQKRQGYTEPHHPFLYQGEGKPYTYKMFSELGYALLRDGGRFSLIIPSGIYSDKGTGSLRALFLKRCQWTHLYAFQNERFVFSAIDHRNKMVVFTVTKGGSTSAILTRFRLGPGDSPEAHELETDILDSKRYLSVPAKQIAKFSPKTGALLEVRTERDLTILEKMYVNGVLLGDDSPQGWGIQYRQGDFNMTSDSKLFPPRPQWEAKGYRPDEYGHWLKGNWQPYEAGGGSRESGVGFSILQRPEGWILSADGSSAIHIDEVEDVALPLYQGVMISQLESNRARWVSGTGNQALWEKDLPPNSPYGSQFLISKESVLSICPNALNPRYLMRNIARTTDIRTMIGSPAPGFPAGHSLASLEVNLGSTLTIWKLGGILSSLTFDWSFRQRLGGTNLSWSFLEEIPTPIRDKLIISVIKKSMSLSAANLNFANQWQVLKVTSSDITKHLWKSLWAITPYERLRLRCILDAAVAELYGLEIDDFAWILRDCDYPTAQVCDKKFARTLEPKGFWRVDKEKDPELRHTVLSLVAFHELKRLGLETFLNLNDGEGWMLPETLRLADYGIGHDNRAKELQPVAARLGDRFLPWQLEGTVEESWQECDRHAQNLKRLLGDKPIATETEPVSAIGESGIQLDFFNLLESQDS
ncbi:Eco57I restriction-modification methylase domain-containing protein [Microcoleus sp. Pol10D4]|uniref:Eco57I restriction-modification methylase domain-containing protein n=1 Tax=Microcoleus sp. Pol10D4 TaxID=3055387 RepID=UPI002FD39AB5